MGGGLGLGTLGAAVPQSSTYLGMAFGYYGLTWSVYSNAIARGAEAVRQERMMAYQVRGADPAVTGSSSVTINQSDVTRC
jgi:hypothetical protein